MVLDQVGGDYRYGFNGQEYDSELGNYSAEYWQYDQRLGRRWNIEPRFYEIAAVSTYATLNNNPIANKDPNGQFAIAIAAGVVLLAILVVAVAVEGLHDDSFVKGVHKLWDLLTPQETYTGGIIIPGKAERMPFDGTEAPESDPDSDNEPAPENKPGPDILTPLIGVKAAEEVYNEYNEDNSTPPDPDPTHDNEEEVVPDQEQGGDDPNPLEDGGEDQGFDLDDPESFKGADPEKVKKFLEKEGWEIGPAKKGKPGFRATNPKDKTDVIHVIQGNDEKLKEGSDVFKDLPTKGGDYMKKGKKDWDRVPLKDNPNLNN